MSTILHPNQDAVARQLGIDANAMTSVDTAVDAIESMLGDAAMEQRARWFAISVFRHLKKAKWVGLEESGLDEEGQLALANDCLAIDGFATSLRTVTKDSRSRFRIVGFASSKNIDRAVLATGTKAYKIAAQVVRQAGHVEGKKARAAKSDSKPALSEKPKKPSVKGAEKSVVARRAKRRGYAGDRQTNVTVAAEQLSSAQQSLSMSEEEFANLDAALSQKDAEIVQRNWGDQPGEERWSRILGILAGAGFFVFVALLFL